MLPTVWLLATGFASSAYAGNFFPYPVTSTTLENGVSVHVIPMPTPGVVACYTWMEVGSRNEVDEGRTGFAHFFEHLMFYGTPTLGREAREREILLLGADENAWTWFDETAYHAVLSTKNLPRYLEIEADRFQNLSLTEEDVRRESGAVYGEFRKGQADPDSRLMETLFATAFTKHPYRHDTIGYEADIAAMPTAWTYAKSFFDLYYRPENANIIVAGDIEPEVVFAEVRKHWSAWETSKKAAPAIPAELPQKSLRRQTITWGTTTAPRIAFGWKIPADRAASSDIAALQLISQLLDSEIGSLHRRLVEEEGLAYSVSADRYALFDPSLLTIQVMVKSPEQLERAEALVLEEVERLKSWIDKDFLDKTRKATRYQFLTSLDDPDEVASAYGWYLRRNNTVDAIDTFYNSYDQQTPETLADVARRFLDTTNLTIVTLNGPMEQSR